MRKYGTSCDKEHCKMDGFNWYVTSSIGCVEYLIVGDEGEGETKGDLGLGSWVCSGLIQWDRDFEEE